MLSESRLELSIFVHQELVMESKRQKADRYTAYLLNKRESFIEHLVRVGVKLVNINDGDYDIEAFIKSFVPSEHFLKNKIAKEVRESQISMSVVQDKSFDSLLLETFRAQVMEIEKDFSDLRKATECDEEIEEVVKNRNTKDVEGNQNSPPTQTSHPHIISQILNSGEMSKILVKKSRVDVLNSKMDEPDFKDDNLETIYIYRAKKC